MVVSFCFTSDFHDGKIASIAAGFLFVCLLFKHLALFEHEKRTWASKVKGLP